jgi:hypothetical protein
VNSRLILCSFALAACGGADFSDPTTQTDTDGEALSSPCTLPKMTRDEMKQAITDQCTALLNGQPNLVQGEHVTLTCDGKDVSGYTRYPCSAFHTNVAGIIYVSGLPAGGYMELIRNMRDYWRSVGNVTQGNFYESCRLKIRAVRPGCFQ